MKNLTLIIFATLSLLLPASLAFGQKSSPFPIASIGFSPSSLFNFYVGIQGSLDLRVNQGLNFTTEVTLIPGVVTPPGYRVKSGLQFLLKDLKNGCFTLGPNVAYQRTSSKDRSNNILDLGIINTKLTTVQVSLDVVASMRLNLSERLFAEFGLSAGYYNTLTQARFEAGAAYDPLEIPGHSEIEPNENITLYRQHKLRPGFNVNFSYIIAK